MRILFTCYPGYGHLHPMLPLARAAVRDGHEVVFATGSDVPPRAQTYGFETWVVGLSSREVAARFNERHPDNDRLSAPERLPLVVPGMFVDIAARATLPDLERRVRDWRPGLIVHDQTEFAAAILGVGTGIPTVTHGWGPRVPLDLVPAVFDAVVKLAAEHGYEDPLGAAAAAPYVDICPPGLQFPGESFWTRLEPMRHEDPPVADGERLPEAVERLPHGETLYVTLGTVVNTRPGVFEEILAGLADLEMNVVVTVGPDEDPARLGEQPHHVHVAQFISQGLLLPRCRAVLAHAGAGTMLGALSHGVPQVLLPQGAEQFVNAAACAMAGAAEVVPPDQLDAATVRGALDRVLAEDSYAAAARRLQAEIAEMPAADETLARLLQPLQ